MLIRDRENLRFQFYDVVKRGHVLLIVGNDVDALCAATILTKLFACDDVPFSIATVSGWEALERTIDEHADQETSIVLLNCGVNQDLDFLLHKNQEETSRNQKIYVIDSRRPICLENVYNQEQVVVLLDAEEESSLNIPTAEEIYPPDSDDESDDEVDENDENRPNRFETLQKKILKQEVRKKWERNRNNLMWNYYEKTWHSMASSVRMLELAAALNRVSSEHMWVAAVGLNSQWTDRLISTEMYTSICIDRMRPFIYRFSPKNTPKADDVLRISFEKDLPLAMYSHWSLYQAMMVNELFACRTKNWTQRGDAEVKHLLAGLGLTLNETKQKYEAMTTERRKEVFNTLEQDMKSTFASFIAHLGYCSRITSADLARALAVKLETPAALSLTERFTNAKEILLPFLEPSGDFLSMRKAFDSYKGSLEVVWTMVSNAVNQSEILPTGPFYLFSSSRELDSDLLESRHFLYNFCHFLLKAFAVSGRGRGRKPLIVSFPLTGERRGYHLVSGIMPLDTVYEDSINKCLIGRVFKEVSRKNGMQEALKLDHFDENIIQLRSSDRSRFFDLLQTVMGST
ncbi:unnamed protein product [Auanema sp. JU1783]|nr:unnamed protein product [Auanema sp. JU1783]